MEAQIGVRLAIRTTRGSQLTPAGIVVAEWAARLLEVADEIDAGLGSLRTEGRQRIRVVASQTIAEQLMPHWMLSLRAADMRRGGTVPEVILTATNSEHAIAAVRDGIADLGFIENPCPPTGLGSVVVARDELVVVVPPGLSGPDGHSSERPGARSDAFGDSRTELWHPRFTHRGVT